MVVVAGGGSRGTVMLRHVPRAAGVRPWTRPRHSRRTPDQDEVCVVWSAATRACDNDRTLNLPHPTLWAARAVSAALGAARRRRVQGPNGNGQQLTAVSQQQTRGRDGRSSRMPKLEVCDTAVWQALDESVYAWLIKRLRQKVRSGYVEDLLFLLRYTRKIGGLWRAGSSRHSCH